MIDPNNAQDMSDEERAFAELTKDSSLADNHPAQRAPADSEDAAGANDDGGDADAGADGADANAAAKPAGAADAGAAAAAAEPFPGYAALPEEVRKHFDTERAERERLAREANEYRNRYSAVQGQTAPVQRQNEDLRRKLQDAERKEREAAARLDKWEKHKLEFPSEAEATEQLIGGVRSEIEELRAHNDRLQGAVAAQQQNALIAQERDALTKAYPEWRSMVFGDKSPDQFPAERVHEAFDPEFGGWFAAQHPAVQSLFGSQLAADNVYLLDMFERDRALADIHANPAPAASTTTTPPANGDVAARRERALSNTAPGLRTTQSGQRNAVALDDEEAAFAALTAGNPLFS